VYANLACKRANAAFFLSSLSANIRWASASIAAADAAAAAARVASAFLASYSH
jgi:hypothetical protein